MGFCVGVFFLLSLFSFLSCLNGFGIKRAANAES